MNVETKKCEKERKKSKNMEQSSEYIEDDLAE